MLKSVIIVLILSVSQIYAGGYSDANAGCYPSFPRKFCTLHRDILLKCVPDPTAGPDSGIQRVFETCGYCCDIYEENKPYCTKTKEECKKISESLINGDPDRQRQHDYEFLLMK